MGPAARLVTVQDMARATSLAEPLIPLTIPGIKRLLAALTIPPLPRRLVIHWDAWTRRHQACSRWFHQRGAP